MSAPTRALRSEASSIRAMVASAGSSASASSSTSRRFTSNRLGTAATTGPNSRSAGAFAKPFGDDVLGPAPDLHALMEGRGVGPAVGQQVVPGDELARLRLDRLTNRLEPRGSAVLGLIEIDHRRPGPLPGVGSVKIKIVSARLERVGVRLELLPRRVALPLDRLARVER